VILVGLTGGIGAGKSTVSTLLARRGALIIDADAITRQLQAPGMPVLADIAAHFGAELIGPDGILDRAALAERVFADPAELEALNSIVHPAVGREITRRVREASRTDQIVVLDIPLLTENKAWTTQGTIVVDAPLETQVERLVRWRGFDEDDVWARIANQASREERLASADVVVDNSGAPEALEAQIDRLWTWLQSLPQQALDR
jgi:dephospho-CoA kinase